MNNYEQIAVEILEKAAETEGLDEERDLNLFEMGLLDSLSVISIIISIEEKLGVRLQPTDFTKEDISTVDNFIEFLKAKATK
ncbi:phosphopantetheine-binding protein [Phascolarctobacterium succinatutens]|uniref:phosphopantetheine-binding protein n=1 Tax=Phascolarctobacterium succinatutens TaxID=626940 RepID=UPI003AB75190